MEVYLIPMTWAVFIFPVLAAVITVPFALYEYHKYGALPWLRTFIVFSFVFYLLTVYCLIILPLPDRADPTAFGLANHLQLRPFNDLIEYAQKYGVPLAPSALITFLRSHTFLQLAFNVLMTLPFGVYLRYYFKRSFLQAVILGFLLSLFFELTQLSALYGYYPAPYRCFDTDDLICNTLGTIIGWLVAPGLLFFLPRREKIDSSAIQASRKVTLFRRVSGTLVDAFLVTLILVGIQILIILIRPIGTTSFEPAYPVSCFFAFQWICALISRGYTPGKSLCHLRVVDMDDMPPTRRRLTLRYALIWFQLCGGMLLSRFLSDNRLYFPAAAQPLLMLMNFVAVFFWFYFILEFLFHLFGRMRGKPFWYERMSGTHSVSVFPVDAETPKT